MVSNRVAPWELLGTSTPKVNNVKEALANVGLDWQVLSRPILVDSGDINNPYISDPRFVANVRADTLEVLGVVSDKYEIVQHIQALGFLDYMIPEGLEIIKGGMINSRKAYLVCKFKSIDVGGDVIEIFVIFTITHDGKGSVRACITPTRISCQNALSLAFRNAYRSWSISHVGNVQGKLHTAEQTMLMMGDYIQQFQQESYRLMDRRLTNAEVEVILGKLFPLENDATPQKENVILERRGIVRSIYTTAPDLGRGTAWDFINAVSDYATHYIPAYNEALYRNSTLNKVIKGHPVIDVAYKLVA